MAGNFQGIGGNGINPMMMQRQQQNQTQGDNGSGQGPHQLQQLLLTLIQQQTGPLNGWQADVGIAERLGHVWHM